MNLEKFASRGLKAQKAVDQIIADDISPAPELAGVGGGASAGRAETAAPRSRQAAGGHDEEPALKSMNSMPFINRTAVRNFLLEHAQATRPHNKFRRVSEETLRDIHESVRQMLIARVHRTPSKGRTM